MPYADLALVVLLVTATSLGIADLYAALPITCPVAWSMTGATTCTELDLAVWYHVSAIVQWLGLI